MLTQHSRCPSRRLKHQGNCYLWAIIRIISNQHFMGYFWSWCQCWKRNACSSIRWQHKWLYLCRTSLWVCQILKKPALIIQSQPIWKRTWSTRRFRKTRWWFRKFQDWWSRKCQRVSNRPTHQIDWWTFSSRKNYCCSCGNWWSWKRWTCWKQEDRKRRWKTCLWCHWDCHLDYHTNDSFDMSWINNRCQITSLLMIFLSVRSSKSEQICLVWQHCLKHSDLLHMLQNQLDLFVSDL